MERSGAQYCVEDAKPPGEWFFCPYVQTTSGPNETDAKPFNAAHG